MGKQTSHNSCFALLLLALLACKGSADSGTEPAPGSGRAPTPPSNDKADQAKREAEAARSEATAARLEVARMKAPSQVTVTSLGCACGASKSIVVTCQITSQADVAVNVDVGASARTGIVGTPATGSAKEYVPAHGSKTVKVTTKYNGIMSCSSAGACTCTKTKVSPAG